MNIFLDTTVLFSDPFLKTNYNNILLSKCNVFISKVVLEEAKRHYEKNIASAYQKLTRAVRDYERYSKMANVIYIPEPNTKEFDDYYKNLHERKIITIVDYSNDLLPVIVDRAIKRIKPFSDKKDEFRDCIIWLSYVQYAEQNCMDDCILISNNTADYYDDAEKSLHPELIKDSNRFKLNKTSKELIEANKEIFFSEPTPKMQYEHLDEEYILGVLDKNTEKLRFAIREYIENTLPAVNFTTWDWDTLKLENYIIHGAASWNYEMISKDELLISGMAVVDAEVGLYAYDAFRDSEDELYGYLDSEDVTLEVNFSFVLKDIGRDSEILSNVEIDYVSMSQYTD